MDDWQGSQLSAIRDLHVSYELRVANAHTVRRIRVAVAPGMARHRVEQLAERCHGQVVALNDAPAIVVSSRDGIADADRDRIVQRIVAEDEFASMVAAYEDVFEPLSLREASHAARNRLRNELTARSLQRAEQDVRARRRRAVEQQPGATEVSEEERSLQTAVRGLRAIDAHGPLRRRVR